MALIVKRFEKKDPHPRCELFYKSRYQLLISVLLSAQATDKIVNRCMEPIYKAGFNPQKALEWGEKKLLSHIRQIGLAPTKTKNVLKLTRMLIDKHSGKVPANREDLEALPGIGRKSANVVLGELFGEPTFAVDTHVYRVSCRLGLSRAKNVLECETDMLKIVDPKYLPRAHQWFVLHGRHVCKARKPECDACLISDLCPSVSLVK